MVFVGVDDGMDWRVGRFSHRLFLQDLFFNEWLPKMMLWKR